MTGLLSLKFGGHFYTLRFIENGWIAADMVQYLKDVYEAADREVAILKLLGYTMEVSRDPPERSADHWVEVDIEQRILRAGSDFIRKAVKQQEPDAEDPYLKLALANTYETLSRLDFTVKLF